MLIKKGGYINEVRCVQVERNESECMYGVVRREVIGRSGERGRGGMEGDDERKNEERR